MDRSAPESKRPAAQWLPAGAAAAVLATVVVAGVALGGGRDDSSGQLTGQAASPAAVAVETTLTVPASVPEVIAEVDSDVPVRRSVLDRTLSKGLAGSDVQEVQQRLTDLGFAPGPIDGIYGDETRKSVWAYEKLVLEVDSSSPTGEITPDMWTDMQDPFVIQPRRPDSTPNHTEVYLPEQVLAVFQGDVPVLITHMSSGTNEEWCEEVTISPGEYGNREGEEPIVRGECGRSNTPGGVFEFYRQVDGIRDSALGSMWNPVYFNYGIAIHGAQNVPLQPASHGCIRIPLGISEGLQDLMDMGDQVFVWDGEKEPEENGSPPPTFNWLDPEWASTTTTTEPETTTTAVSTTSTTVAAVPEPTSPAEPTTAATTPSTTDTSSTTTSTSTITTSSTTTSSTTTSTTSSTSSTTTSTTVPASSSTASSSTALSSTASPP